MTVIKNTVTGRNDTSYTPVMSHVRKPVFVDNAIHHGHVTRETDSKPIVTIETTPTATYQVMPETDYLIVEGESNVQLSHVRTNGHSYTNTPYFGASTVSSTNLPKLLYNSNSHKERLLPSTTETSTIGSTIHLKNMKNRDLFGIGFNDNTVKLGQPIDVGLRTTDLALRLGEKVGDKLTSVNIGMPRKISNANTGRRYHSLQFLAQDFNKINLKTGLKFISRHDNRMVLLDRFGNLLYVPYRFSESTRMIQKEFRFGGFGTTPVDDLPNRIAVQGVSQALNDNVYVIMDDGEKQSGDEGEVREEPTAITDMTVTHNRGARRTARQILKAYSLISGKISSDGHALISDLRPGMTVIFDGESRIITEISHVLSRGTSDLVMLNIDTGLEGVLQGVTEGAISVSAEENPESSIQNLEESLAFFGDIKLNIITVTRERGVASTGLLIGGTKGTFTRGKIGKKDGLPIGTQKAKEVRTVRY